VLPRFSCAVLLVAALLAPAAAIAQPDTTAPTVIITVNVTLTDKAIRLSRHQAPRGSDVRFAVTNVGRRSHTFTLGTTKRGLGKQTGFSRVFKPGQHQVLLLFLDYRGVLPYFSNLPADLPKRAMHGKFVVGADVTGSVDH
jgi:hypothetical protein